MSVEVQILGKPFEDNAAYVEIKPGQSVHRILLDCGEGCLDRLRPSDIMATDHLCFSHFHLDHVAGFDTYIRMNYNREGKPVRIWGPRGTRGKVHHRLRSITWDRVEDSPGEWQVSEIHRDTIATSEFRTREKFQAEHSIGDSKYNWVIYSEEDYTIEASVLSHRSPSVAYKISEKDSRVVSKPMMKEIGLPSGLWAALIKDFEVPDSEKITIEGKEYGIGMLREKVLKIKPGESVAYATDYVWEQESVDSLVEMISGCDVFISEATYTSEDENLAQRHYHVTAQQAAQIARKAGVKKLYLFHVSKRYEKTGLSKSLKEAREYFKKSYFNEDW